MNFLQQDVNQGQFGDGCFDVVFAKPALHHIEANFEVLNNFAFGGTVMNLLLYGERVNRFDANDPFHNAILEEAVQYERQLLDSGQLSSDFRFVIAQVKV